MTSGKPDLLDIGRFHCALFGVDALTLLIFYVSLDIDNPMILPVLLAVDLLYAVR